MVECAAPATSQQILVTDLLADAEALTSRLGQALRDEDWLDAYLLCAGLSQLVEDRLHPNPLAHRLVSHLRGQPSRAARLAAAAAQPFAVAARARAGPPSQRLRRARPELTRLITQLADRVLGLEPAADLIPLPSGITSVAPALAGDRLRIPSCFHSFDQHPDDVRWLVSAFRRQYRAGGPLCVVGVRTSGSYLAPLHAAALRASGDSPVEVMTYRPGRPFLRRERTTLTAIADSGGLVLVADDPPGSGTSLAATASAVARAGVPDSRIILLLSLFGGSDALPERLHRWPAVIQPWADWSVHNRITAQRVKHTLATLVGPDTEVGEVRPLPPPGVAPERGHVRARFDVRLSSRATGETVARHVVAEGAGLGYFGRAGAAVASALPGHVPHVYGFANGLLYRDWLPAGPQPPSGHALPETIAGYVLARQRALPALTAAPERLAGRDPAWQVAAKVVSGQYGPLALPALPLLLEPVMRRLLAHDTPAIVDGKTDPRHWLADPAAGGGPRKVDFYQRTFGHLDLVCYDPVFDLAGAAADPPEPGFEARLREAYQRAGGQHVDGERWLLYRLGQLWRLGRAGDLGPARVRRQSAAAVHEYLASLYLRDLPPAAGPLCAIDLDGVLECDRLGYPATSPTGVRALRALVAHGYRPVLATGRSLADVADRCAAFGLAGGVAEYGAALCDSAGSTDLRPAAERALLEQVRRELSGLPGVETDPLYRHTVRARTGAGPLPPGLVTAVPALAGPGLRLIHGRGQTDITVAGVDKASGLHALARRLRQPGWALAVGDTPPDLPMLDQALLGRAPRNARFGADGARITRTRGAYQAGLSDACADLLGHRPGQCQLCRVPSFAPRTRALLSVLDLHANGLASVPGRTAALGALLLGRDRWS